MDRRAWLAERRSAVVAVYEDLAPGKRLDMPQSGGSARLGMRARRRDAMLILG
jgi:hypothetical protein